MADVEADVKVTRSRLLAAIAAGNVAALNEVLGSLPAGAEAELEAEAKAARKAIELVTSSERAVSAGDDDQAVVIELRQKLADAEEAHRASQAAVEANDALVAELKQELEAARGVASGGGSPAHQLGAVQQATRINELQSVVVQLQTQLRQSEQVRPSAC